KFPKSLTSTRSVLSKSLTYLWRILVLLAVIGILA
ncbi:Uncharacterized protein TCM_005279 isoform 2, partial [Theobroma cacao]